MSVYDEKIINKPQKAYWCDLCGRPITGRHLRIFRADGVDFWRMRVHIECQEKMDNWCASCEYRGDCQSDICECFYENSKEEANP
jgi:hypothetical protein